MAVIEAVNRLYTNQLYIAELRWGTYTVQSPTLARVQFWFGTAELTGSFTYKDGALSGGTLTGFTCQSQDGAVHYRVSGLSYDVARMLTLQGDPAGNILLVELYAGADSFVGGDAPLGDAIAGYEGNDTIIAGDGGDGVQAGDGNDSVSGGAGDDFLFGDDITGSTEIGDDTVYGLAGNDVLGGARGNDVMNGNQGSDTLMGASGADDLRGGRDNDILQGDDGDDPLLNGNMGADTVYGGAGNDSLWGGQDNDRLQGDAGHDWLSGDLGADTLTGGAGGDRFVFREGVGSDVIADFNFAEGDRIVIALTQGVVSVTDSAAGAVLDIGQGATVTFAGFQVAQVSAEWITYG